MKETLIDQNVKNLDINPLKKIRIFIIRNDYKYSFLDLLIIYL